MVTDLLLFAALGAALALVAYFVFASFLFGAGYQPAPPSVVRSMLELARVGPDDRLYDLGAGTGAIVFRAARDRGASVVAVEVEPMRVLWLRIRRRLSPAARRIEVRWGDLYHQSFQDASVVAVFLWPEAMRRLRPVFERELRPGARVVSHWHPVPGWEPSAHDAAHRVYLYQR